MKKRDVLEYREVVADCFVKEPKVQLNPVVKQNLFHKVSRLVRTRTLQVGNGVRYLPRERFWPHMRMILGWKKCKSLAEFDGDLPKHQAGKRSYYVWMLYKAAVWTCRVDDAGALPGPAGRANLGAGRTHALLGACPARPSMPEHPRVF